MVFEVSEVDVPVPAFFLAWSLQVVLPDTVVIQTCVDMALTEEVEADPGPLALAV